MHPSNPAFRISRMTRPLVDFTLELAAQEGWNPGLHDADCFYRADPQGFFVGMLGDRPIGCISAVAYAEGFGFIGLYIVRPEYRGQGYGLPLWHTAMDYLAGRNIGLDGVVEQQPNYLRSGFRSAYRNIRCEGVATPADRQLVGLVDVVALPFDDLCRYDRRLFPSERREFLRCWVHQPETHALAWVRTGILAGYGVIRRCHRGYKLGPLFADDAEIARRLYRGLCAQVEPGAPVYLDVPEVNPEAVALTQEHGMTRVFETARMYTGEPPSGDLRRVFGVTTFELG
jgi:hypothetical protein